MMGAMVEAAGPKRRTPPVVIGVDIGTTSTKAVAFDDAGSALASHSAGYSLQEPKPGYAVQDPEEIRRAAYEAVHATAAAVGPGRVTGLSFSAAMHSLIGCAPGGVALTPVLTWADTRASRQADRLRGAAGGLALHRRTGTPLHPMSPLTKLVWFREQEPDLFQRVGHWLGIKEYVLSRLCGPLVVDHSTAAAMGVLDLSRLEWDPEALALAGITAGQLPELVGTRTVLDGLTAQGAADTGLRRGTPVVMGASDGPMANLGLGAVRAGVAACSIGTSGALRVAVAEPMVDPLGRVFCYPMTEDRWVVGGAINNGGVVLGWAGDALAPDLTSAPEDDLLALAERVPVGSGGLIMLPYLLGERAPHWSSLPRGAYVGLTRRHRREHLVRAALEGVCQQLALVLESLRAAGLGIEEVRATGGFARSALWRQMLADALGVEVAFTASHEGSSFGAALLGMEALGIIESIDVAADLVEIGMTVQPDPEAAATYASLRPVISELYDALLPTFATLRELAPGLPLELPD